LPPSTLSHTFRNPLPPELSAAVPTTVIEPGVIESPGAGEVIITVGAVLSAAANANSIPEVLENGESPSDVTNREKPINNAIRILALGRIGTSQFETV
jgi:hypothetical protein